MKLFSVLAAFTVLAPSALAGKPTYICNNTNAAPTLNLGGYNVNASENGDYYPLGSTSQIVMVLWLMVYDFMIKYKPYFYNILKIIIFILMNSKLNNIILFCFVLQN